MISRIKNFRIGGFFRAYKQVAKKSGIMPFNWPMYAAFLLWVVPLSLIVFHLFIINGIIPHDFFNAYISLRYASPNAASMFLSNYAHMTMDNGNHLFLNVINFEVTILMILSICLVLLPLVHYEFPAFKFTFDPDVFRGSIILYFLVVPFIVSAASAVAGTLREVAGGRGFSGILCAFEGYMVYLGIRIVLEKGRVRRSEGGRGSRIFYRTSQVVAVLLPCIFFITIITDFLTMPSSNVVGHITGFISGLLIPFMLEEHVGR